MKPLDRQKLDVVNQTRSNPALRSWRGQFAVAGMEWWGSRTAVLLAD